MDTFLISEQESLIENSYLCMNKLVITGLIELKKVSFTYQGKIDTNIFSLPELNLKINSGDFISIMGPNGSGKSTLLKLISHLLLPNSGEIYLDGNNISSLPLKELAKIIAFVPQNTSISFPYSVYETVMMGRAPHLNFMGFESQKDHEKVMEVLEMLEILDLKDKGINEISGGESQRALIARALAQEPKVILLDEPNAHLDIRHQVSIFNLLKKFNKEDNLTVIIISHDLNLTNYFCNRVLLMKSGKVLFDERPAEVLTEDNLMNIFGVSTNFVKNENNEHYYIGINPNEI